MNVEIGTEAAQFPEKEYINEIFVAVLLIDTFERFPTFSDSFSNYFLLWIFLMKCKELQL